MLKYGSIRELVDAANEKKTTISRIALSDQAMSMETTEEALYAQMRDNFTVMRDAVRFGQKEEQRSMSGLTGGEGFHMNEYAQRNNGGLCGEFMTKAIARALAVAGCNASMGRIVAAPTAGSCGILPGCLVSLYEDRGIDEKTIVMSMFTAGAFGIVIAQNASIAGAEGGCQAECGSAAAMAAAALVEISGGTPEQSADACAIAIASQLGLVCDPVAGLVEIPCIKRNASGVMIAISSADMALAGIPAMIPADECISAMREVGHALPASLKETAGGGLAVTKTGQMMRRKVFGE